MVPDGSGSGEEIATNNELIFAGAAEKAYKKATMEMREYMRKRYRDSRLESRCNQLSDKVQNIEEHMITRSDLSDLLKLFDNHQWFNSDRKQSLDEVSQVISLMAANGINCIIADQKQKETETERKVRK